MEIIRFFASEWAVIAQAPATFLIAALLIAGACYAAASWRFGGIIESQRAQIELLDRKVSSQPGGADIQKRKAIADKLADFLTSGVDIQGRLAAEPPIADEAEAQKWLNEVVEYTEKELGKPCVARLRDSSTVPVAYTSLTGDQARLWGGFRSKVYHVQEFIREMVA